MLDLSSIFGAMGGTMLLILFPMVCAIGIGLLWIGIVRKRFVLALMGIVFPLAVGLVGNAMRANALNSADATATLPLGMATLEMLLPYGIWLGVGVFLIAVLPAGLKVTFSR